MNTKKLSNPKAGDTVFVNGFASRVVSAGKRLKVEVPDLGVFVFDRERCGNFYEWVSFTRTGARLNLETEVERKYWALLQEVRNLTARVSMLSAQSFYTDKPEVLEEVCSSLRAAETKLTVERKGE